MIFNDRVKKKKKRCYGEGDESTDAVVMPGDWLRRAWMSITKQCVRRAAGGRRGNINACVESFRQSTPVSVAAAKEKPVAISIIGSR